MNAIGLPFLYSSMALSDGLSGMNMPLLGFLGFGNFGIVLKGVFTSAFLFSALSSAGLPLDMLSCLRAAHGTAWLNFATIHFLGSTIVCIRIFVTKVTR